MKRTRTERSRGRLWRLRFAGVAIVVVVVALVVTESSIASSGTNAARRTKVHPSISKTLERTPKSFISGDSKATCLFAGAAGWAARLAQVESLTGIKYNCITTFSNADPHWTDWVSPWLTQTFGFAQWLAQDPADRTIILTQQLIPDSVCTSVCGDPLAWETACDSGAYNSYATALATELVSTGFGSSIIRLGAEMNGSWENDYAGTTVREQQAWAKCFAQEVSAMQSVPGQHLQFDWNVNECVDDDVLSNLYPGNAYVDIVGIDAYDSFCGTIPAKGSAAAFAQLASEPDGIDAVTAFAKAHGKPMSLPEWGAAAPSFNGVGDDGSYVAGIAQYVASNDVAFQSYFDSGTAGTIELTRSDPNTLAAYVAAFG